MSFPPGRPLLLFALALTLPISSGTAEAAALGAFQIRASGEQKLNLETGQTELPHGGTATDSRNGLTLTGKTMSYLAGQSLQATGASIRTAAGGTLSADTVRYDVKSGVLKASGHLSYASSLLRGLSADSISLYTASGAVVASGHVKASLPALSAGRVVALGGGQGVLLSGSYTLNSGGARYAGTSPSARLLLTGTGSRARAIPQPSDTVIRNFLPYLK